MTLATVGLRTQVYNNHVKSVLLLLGFPLLLLLMLGGFFAVLETMTQASVTEGHQLLYWPHIFDAGLAGVYLYGHWALLGAGVWFTIAYFFHGRIMRAATGSRPVTRQEYPKLYNMLENLCISRGLPVPAFEIIDSDAFNAFATGIDRKSYKIVLTRGIVENLQDDELEAVIGHELTHIINRDVRLLIIAVVFVGIISFLAQMVYRMLVSGIRPSRRAQEGKRSSVIIMLVALAILMVGYVLATVIRFALSRKREYLADAGSIELTKNPEAMMRALMRIAGREKMPYLPNGVQQMCIENSQAFAGIFATHPKIEDRIKMISEMTGTPIPVLGETKGPWG